jgi:hypothetical protein
VLFTSLAALIIFGGAGLIAVLIERARARYARRVYHVETEHEVRAGRWIAEIPELPGCMMYGATSDQAVAAALALASRIVADRARHAPTVCEKL